MWKLRPLLSVLAVCLLCSLAAAQRSRSPWQTLYGDAPIVTARGGFSGVFPDSSYNAYVLALNTGPLDLVSWCDVQLTKDGNAMCTPEVTLDNTTDVADVYKARPSTKYLVNGAPVEGHFTVDFTARELMLLTLSQNVLSRSPNFDGAGQVTLMDNFTSIKPPVIWLNVQHDEFYSQHNQSMRNYIIGLSRRVVLNYISSPEVGFLRSIASRFRPPTKLIFRFLTADAIEPSTNQSYGSLLKNLTFVKTFASGILVPKSYILPVGPDSYLQTPTSLVSEAHQAGLEIHASEFASDADLAYDYNFDPVAEYLSYVDNGNFSVDGVLTDFPLTTAATFDCFAHMGRNESDIAKFLIMTSEGASGIYPGCTDLSYTRAIEDGADVIDCPVQMSQDGVPFCLGSINLIERTDAAQSRFSNVSMNVPEININGGIFPFNLTWIQIQSLKPSMFNPWSAKYGLIRNPKEASAGKLLQLSEFLDIAKNASSITGVMITIERAAFLARSAGLGVVDAVLDTLNTSGFNNLPGKKVYIQSPDSSVLKRIGKTNNYDLIYFADEPISDATNATVSDIKTFATSVMLYKRSLIPVNEAFLTGETNIAEKFQTAGLAVYVQTFNNEFVSQAYDFLSDPYLEVNTFFSQAGVAGMVTAFPLTASKFRKNRCLAYREIPPYMLPVQPGGLLDVMLSAPPAQAPYPVLAESDVAEAPLPPVAVFAPPLPNRTTPAPPTALPGGSGQATVAANTVASSLALVLATLAVLVS